MLGIIVPTIEAATGLPWEHEAERRGDKVEKLDILAVFSTPATAASRVYEIEIDKRRQDVAVFSEPCPELARMIEAGAAARRAAAVIQGHVKAIATRIGRAARPRDPGLHPLRDRRRPVPRGPAARHAADPPAAGHRRRAGALFRAPPGVRRRARRRSSLPDHRPARARSPAWLKPSGAAPLSFERA